MGAVQSPRLDIQLRNTTVWARSHFTRRLKDNERRDGCEVSGWRLSSCRGINRWEWCLGVGAAQEQTDVEGFPVVLWGRSNLHLWLCLHLLLSFYFSKYSTRPVDRHWKMNVLVSPADRTLSLGLQCGEHHNDGIVPGWSLDEPPELIPVHTDHGTPGTPLHHLLHLLCQHVLQK